MIRTLPSLLALALTALLGSAPWAYPSSSTVRVPGSVAGALDICPASGAGHALGSETGQVSWTALPSTPGNDGAEKEMERHGGEPSVGDAADAGLRSPSPVLYQGHRSSPAVRAPHLLELTSHPPTAPPQQA